MTAEGPVPDGAHRAVSGYASLFGLADLAGDVVRRGAFARALAGRRRPLPMLFQHDPADPVGVWTRVYEDARGLRVEGRIVAGTERARSALRLVESGAVDGLSIGYRTRRYRPRPGGGRELLEVDLWEVSLVTFPMLTGARLDRAPEPGRPYRPSSENRMETPA